MLGRLRLKQIPPTNITKINGNLKRSSYNTIYIYGLTSISIPKKKIRYFLTTYLKDNT